MNRLHATFAALAITALSTGCGPGKIDQCNALVDEGNKAQGSFIALEAALLSQDATQQRIDKIAASAKAVKDVKLADPKLVDFRDRFAKGLDEYAKLLTEMKPLIKVDGKEDEYNKRVDALNKISEDEDKLIDEVNKYCSP